MTYQSATTNLFADQRQRLITFHEALRSTKQKASLIPTKDLKNIHVQETLENLFNELNLNVPVLDLEHVHGPEFDDSVQIGLGKSNNPKYVTKIPFKGNSDFFSISPSVFNYSLPVGSVERNILTLVWEFPSLSGLTKEILSSKLIKEIESINERLNQLKQDVVIFKQQLMSEAGNILHQRKAQYDQAQDL